jgi:microcystin-dependent protein
VSPGKLAVNAGGITSNELAASAVTTNALADGAVTQAKTSNMLVPTGAIMAFAMNGAPTGWLSADGSAVSRTTYSALWTALGTTSSPYGQGDGSTTFNLPDLRGYFVRGSGTNSDGTTSGTFGVKQSHMFQTHGHSASSDVQGDHAHTYSAPDFISEPGGSSGPVQSDNRAFFATSTAGAHSHNITVGAPNSGNSGSETRPANIALLYCIKL